MFQGRGILPFLPKYSSEVSLVRQLAVAVIIIFNSNTMLDMIFLAVLFTMLISLMEILGQVDPQVIELNTRVGG